MRLVAGLLLTLVVAGCGPTASTVAPFTFAEVSASCAHMKPVARARCVNDGELVIQGPLQGDLLRQHQALRLVLAEKIEAKKITEAEAALEFARNNTALISEAQARASADQAQRARNAAIMMQAYQINKPIQTSCVRTGVYSQCSSY